MKRIRKITGISVLTLTALSSVFLFSGCDFNVNYKGTSEKLNEAVSVLDGECFTKGTIAIESENFELAMVPKVSSKFVGDDDYIEVNSYYNTIFSYCNNYIKENAKILETPPTVESLTEYQEDLYKKLDKEIATYKQSLVDFKIEIEDINKYYNNSTSYGETSEENFVRNYKKAYRDLIYDAFDVSNAIEDVMDNVYKEIDYVESSEKEGKVFKSLEKGISIRIFEGYFSFIVDSFDCRVPIANQDANSYMHEILETYANAKKQMVTFFKNSSKGDTNISISEKEIERIQALIDIYFEETELYQNAYDKIGFEKFYFDNDCALDMYIRDNYANKNYYEKINDYINYTLPNLTNYISSTFSAQK